MGFGTTGDWVWFLIIVAVIGYGTIRGCEAGCGYVNRHVGVELRK